MNCLHSFKAEENHNSHENVCKSNKWCETVMPNEENKIMKYNHGQKSIKVPFIIYVGFETIL